MKIESEGTGEAKFLIAAAVFLVVFAVVVGVFDHFSKRKTITDECVRALRNPLNTTATVVEVCT